MIDVTLKPTIAITPYNKTVCFETDEFEGCQYWQGSGECDLFGDQLEETDDENLEVRGYLRCEACLASEVAE